MTKLEQDASKMTGVKGSGNVFADLGLPYPDEDLAKAELAFAIRERIKAKGLTQTEAAAALPPTSRRFLSYERAGQRLHL